jgi:hypothetical protein
MEMTRQKAQDSADFKVKGLLGNTHLQSLLASSKLRKRLKSKQVAGLIENQHVALFDGGNGIRLHGYYSPTHFIPARTRVWRQTAKSW